MEVSGVIRVFVEIYLCRSVNLEGFIFDYAPHILFTRDPYAKELYNKLLEGNLLTQERRAYIYMKDTYIKYPFEVNLHPLPKQIIDECIDGVINKKNKVPKNFLEWINTTFGEGIAKHYMVPYNQKIWKYSLEKMNTEWIAGRVPSPSVDEMKKGAKGDIKKDYGPNAFFMYPKYGGIGALATNLSMDLKISSLRTSLRPPRAQFPLHLHRLPVQSGQSPGQLHWQEVLPRS